MKQFTFNPHAFKSFKGVLRQTILLCWFLAGGSISYAYAGPDDKVLNVSDCNDPLSGKGVVVDDLFADCLLCGNGDLENLLDGDLSNYTTFTAPATVLVPRTVVSIKDVDNDYAAGDRVGFVIKPVGGLISASVLGGFQLRTYLNNTLQETVTGSSLTLTNQGDLRRLNFVSTKAFDEVELRIVSVLGVLTSVRVYYAYREPASGCDYACVNAIAPTAYASSINDPATGIFGICVLCSLTNEANVVDDDTTNAAHIHLPIGVGGNAVIAVKANQDIPANYEAGFAVRQGTGLLNLTLLGAITISTYDNGTLKESVVANNSLANVSLLGGSSDVNLIGFKTTQAFDEVRIRVNGISLLVDLDVFYAYVRPDDDNDGYANCVDKCAGHPDYLDADGDGTPDDCDDPVCTLNAGLDLSICPAFSTAQLPAAGSGESWSALSGNPAPATVSNAGAVSGMTAEGTYGFVLSKNLCHDTVYINRFESTLDAACNNPIVGPKVVITDPGAQDCLLCVNGQVAIDGLLSNSVALNVATSITGATTLLAVKDTSQVYPAGRRTGFVVLAKGALLNATLLSNFQIRTYLNGTLRETATVSGGVLTAGALTGDKALQRLSFVTTLSFNEVELVATATLNLLTEFRVYYAFEEPGSGCPALDGETCAEALNAGDMTYCGQLEYERTGVVGVACVGCALSNLGNIIDEDLNSYATIQLTVGIGASGQVSVNTRQTIPAGYTAGYVISGPPNILDATVLGGLRVRTYLNGVLKEEYLASGGLLQVQVLNASTGRAQLSFVTTQSFNEVQLRVDGLVTALATVNVHYAYVRKDSDADGAPDCADKCCGGDDTVDTNGNGVPNSCDPLPLATDDVVTTNEDVPVNVLVLGNDQFGGDGPGNPSLAMVASPSHGTVVLNNNGTPLVLTDDYVVYTPAANYNGADQFSYRICDSSNDCDTAVVQVTVTPVDDMPVAGDDVFSLSEDNGAANILVLTNDNFGGEGPSSGAITIQTPPAHGTAVVNNNGTPNNPADDYLVYTPAANYSGSDQIVYQICDADNDCDQATVNITVTPVPDPPIALNDVANTPESQAVSIPVLVNDTDADGNLDTAALSILTPPQHGTATPDLVNGTINYTPSNNFYGADTFRYVICDKGMPALCDTAVVAITISANKVRLWVKMQLQGALYDSPDTLMRDDLRAENKLPATEPYTALAPAFVHVNGGGGETVANPSAVFADLGPNSIVDWVFIELRDSAQLGLVLATRAALLQRDGDVVDVDGSSVLVFSQSVPKSYAVAIRHRHHLGCMTSASVALSGTGTVIDFSNTSTALWDDNTNLNGLEQVTIEGRYALWADNVNTNRNVVFAGQNNDKDPIFNQVDQAPGNFFRSQTYIFNGYHLGDVNMDGSAVFAGQHNDVDPIFNNVDQHPKNVLKSQTFIIRQQLAQ